MAKGDFMDGFTSLQGGVNSDLAPQLLPDDTVHFATNCTFSGGFPHNRPKWVRLNLSFDTNVTEAAFNSPGLFQAMEYYRPDDINRMQELILSIAGKIYRVIPSATAPTAAVDYLPGPAFNAFSKIVWMCQAERWMIMRDGTLQSPNIYDGGTVFAASALPKPNPIGPGRQMGYTRGAVWQVMTDGRSYTMGDVIYSTSGTAPLNFRDAVLYNTPNGIIAGGANFAIPGNFGIVMAMCSSSVLDVSMGQGPLHIVTQFCVFSVTPPTVAKASWSTLTDPIATVSLIQQGGLSQWSTLQMNGDLIFRAFDGIRSLIIGRRDFTTWGNTPISSEMNAVMDYDDPALLTVSSSAVFDNRLLMTVAPALDEPHGVFHRGLAVMNNEVLSSLRGKSPSIYDGLWTGPDVLRITSGVFANVNRCFAAVLSQIDPANPRIEIWELTAEEGEDEISGNHIPIFWTLETGAFFKKSLLDLKRLVNGLLWVDRLYGKVRYRVLYKPDNHPCWIPWTNWEECATNSVCPQPNLGVPAPSVATPHFRVRMPFGSPSVTPCDPITNRPYRNFYTVQLRFEIQGRCRIVGLKLRACAEEEPEWPQPKCPPESAVISAAVPAQSLTAAIAEVANAQDSQSAVAGMGAAAVEAASASDTSDGASGAFVAASKDEPASATDTSSALGGEPMDMAIWLDASVLAQGNNTPMTPWIDLSGNGNNFTTTSGNMVVFTNVQNGLRGVYLGGGAGSVSAGPSFAAGDPITIIGVWKHDSGAAASRAIQMTGSNFAMGSDNNTQLRAVWVNGGVTVLGQAVTSQTDARYQTLTSSTGAGYKWIVQAGGTQTGATATPGGLISLGRASIIEDMAGHMFELRVWTRILTNAEITATQNALTTKWNLAPT